jgi:hypothetical protein
MRWRGLPGVPVALRWRPAVRPFCGLDADACRAARRLSPVVVTATHSAVL